MGQDEDFIEEFTLDALFADMPKVQRYGFYKVQRYGFYSDSSLDLGPEFADVRTILVELAEADEPYTDEDGYTWQVPAHMLDDQHCRMAWVEKREKSYGRYEAINYYLKARDKSGKLFVWEIETYNPYFGCRVEFLQWVEEAMVMIYEDKHSTFVVRLQAGCEVKRREISAQWEVQQNRLHCHLEHRAATLMLPGLEEL